MPEHYKSFLFYSWDDLPSHLKSRPPPESGEEPIPTYSIWQEQKEGIELVRTYELVDEARQGWMLIKSGIPAEVVRGFVHGKVYQGGDEPQATHLVRRGRRWI